MAFSYNNMFRACVIPNPPFGFHALQFNVMHRHYRCTATSRQEVSPPRFQCLTIPIPLICASYPSAAFRFVQNVFRSLRVIPTASHVQSLVSCVLRSGSLMGSVSVVASMELARYDVVRILPQSFAFDSDEETFILDSTSSSASSSSSSVGISKELLETITFDETIHGEGSQCSICLEEFEEGCSAIRTPCAHLFHSECIDMWIEQRNDQTNCPLCRSSLFA